MKKVFVKVLRSIDVCGLLFLFDADSTTTTLALDRNTGCIASIPNNPRMPKLLPKENYVLDVTPLEVKQEDGSTKSIRLSDIVENGKRCGMKFNSKMWKLDEGYGDAPNDLFDGRNYKVTIEGHQDACGKGKDMLKVIMEMENRQKLVWKFKTKLNRKLGATLHMCELSTFEDEKPIPAHKIWDMTYKHVRSDQIPLNLTKKFQLKNFLDLFFPTDRRSEELSSASLKNDIAEVGHSNLNFFFFKNKLGNIFLDNGIEVYPLTAIPNSLKKWTPYFGDWKLAQKFRDARYNLWGRKEWENGSFTMNKRRHKDILDYEFQSSFLEIIPESDVTETGPPGKRLLSVLKAAVSNSETVKVQWKTLEPYRVKADDLILLGKGKSYDSSSPSPNHLFMRDPINDTIAIKTLSYDKVRNYSMNLELSEALAEFEQLVESPVKEKVVVQLNDRVWDSWNIGNYSKINCVHHNRNNREFYFLKSIEEDYASYYKIQLNESGQITKIWRSVFPLEKEQPSPFKKNFAGGWFRVLEMKYLDKNLEFTCNNKSQTKLETLQSQLSKFTKKLETLVEVDFLAKNYVKMSVPRKTSPAFSNLESLPRVRNTGETAIEYTRSFDPNFVKAFTLCDMSVVAFQDKQNLTHLLPVSLFETGLRVTFDQLRHPNSYSNDGTRFVVIDCCAGNKFRAFFSNIWGPPDEVSTVDGTFNQGEQGLDVEFEEIFSESVPDESYPMYIDQIEETVPNALAKRVFEKLQESKLFPKAPRSKNKRGVFLRDKPLLDHH